MSVCLDSNRVSHELFKKNPSYRFNLSDQIRKKFLEDIYRKAYKSRLCSHLIRTGQ